MAKHEEVELITEMRANNHIVFPSYAYCNDLPYDWWSIQLEQQDNYPRTPDKFYHLRI